MTRIKLNATGLITIALLSSNAQAELLGPNPFLPKSTIFPKAVAVFVQSAKRPEIIDHQPIITEDGVGILKIDYHYFQLWVDCPSRTTIAFEYEVNEIESHYDREPLWSAFYYEDAIPKRCQQSSSLPYGEGYIRTQLVPSRFLPESKEPKLFARSVPNVFPMISTNSINSPIKEWEAALNTIDKQSKLGKVTVRGDLSWSDSSRLIQTHKISPPAQIRLKILRQKNTTIFFETVKTIQNF